MKVLSRKKKKKKKKKRMKRKKTHEHKNHLHLLKEWMKINLRKIQKLLKVLRRRS